MERFIEKYCMAPFIKKPIYFNFPIFPCRIFLFYLRTMNYGKYMKDDNIK